MKQVLIILMMFIAPLHLAWANVNCYNHTTGSYAPSVFDHVFAPALAQTSVHNHHEHCASHTQNNQTVTADTNDVNSNNSNNSNEHSTHCEACAHLSLLVQKDFIWPVHQKSYAYFSVDYSFLTLASSEAVYRPKWL